MRMFILIITVIFLSAGPAMGDTVMSKAAASMGSEMDNQLADRFGQQEGVVNGISVIITTPVDLNNLEESNPVARQMQEELARWFIRSGYSVQEVRGGKALLLRPSTGELLLTRNRDLASTRTIQSALTMVSTYSMTSRNIVFNVRLMQTGGNEVFAMSNVTLPISGELRAMLGTASSDSSSPSSSLASYLIEPSVFSRLP